MKCSTAVREPGRSPCPRASCDSSVGLRRSLQLKVLPRDGTTGTRQAGCGPAGGSPGLGQTRALSRQGTCSVSDPSAPEEFELSKWQFVIPEDGGGGNSSIFLLFL